MVAIFGASTRKISQQTRRREEQHTGVKDEQGVVNIFTLSSYNVSILLWCIWAYF